MAAIQWTRGNTYDTLALTLQSQDGTPLSLAGLAGSAITVLLRPNMPLSLPAALAGSATITNAATGQISYQFAASDIAVPGSYYLEVHVAFSGASWLAFESLFIISQA